MLRPPGIRESVGSSLPGATILTEEHEVHTCDGHAAVTSRAVAILLPVRHATTVLTQCETIPLIAVQSHLATLLAVVTEG